MKVLWTSLRQAFGGIGFWLAVLGTVLALLAAGFETLNYVLQAGGGPLQEGMLLSLLRESISSDTMQFVMPIVAALPFTASYYDDLHSGFIKAYLLRSGYQNYIVGKVAACFVSGGMVPVAGILCFGILAGSVILPRETYSAASLYETGWILKSYVLLFCSGAFWSLVGMTAAALTNSKHMAYAAPFVFFYVLVILSERYFKTIPYLNPKEWMNPAAKIWVGAMLLILSVLVSLAFIHSAGRRLKNL